MQKLYTKEKMQNTIKNPYFKSVQQNRTNNSSINPGTLIRKNINPLLN